MIDVVRYTVSRCALSQVWMPPLIAYLLIIGVSYPPGAAALGSIIIGTVVLLVVAAWIGLATVNSESAPQRAALAAEVGGALRYRLALLLAAAFASILLTPVSVGFAMINDPGRLTFLQLAVAVVAHLVAAVTGVGVSALVSEPLINRAGPALLIAAAILIAVVAVPGLSPVRFMETRLEALPVRPRDLSLSIVDLAVTSAAAGLVGWLSGEVARRRA